MGYYLIHICPCLRRLEGRLIRPRTLPVLEHLIYFYDNGRLGANLPPRSQRVFITSCLEGTDTKPNLAPYTTRAWYQPTIPWIPTKLNPFPISFQICNTLTSYTPLTSLLTYTLPTMLLFDMTGMTKLVVRDEHWSVFTLNFLFWTLLLFIYF